MDSVDARARPSTRPHPSRDEFGAKWELTSPRACRELLGERANAFPMSESTSKTVQEYIDETPNWSDGTRVADAPMTPMQWRIWMLATA